MDLRPEVVVPPTAVPVAGKAREAAKRGWAAIACLLIGGASAGVALARAAIAGTSGSLTVAASIPLIACFWLAILSVVRREERPIALGVGLAGAAVGAFFGLPLLILASLAVLGLIAFMLQ